MNLEALRWSKTAPDPGTGTGGSYIQQFSNDEAQCTDGMPTAVPLEEGIGRAQGRQGKRRCSKDAE